MSDPVKFERTVREESQVVRRQETLTAHVGEYDVYVGLDDSLVEVSVVPHTWDRGRLGIVKMYPKNVADLEGFAEQARDLLLGIAAALRSEGLVDLRGKHDKWRDEFEESFKRQVAASLGSGSVWRGL